MARVEKNGMKSTTNMLMMKGSASMSRLAPYKLINKWIWVARGGEDYVFNLLCISILFLLTILTIMPSIICPFEYTVFNLLSHFILKKF